MRTVRSSAASSHRWRTRALFASSTAQRLQVLPLHGHQLQGSPSSSRAFRTPFAGRCHPKRAGAERPANHTVFKGPLSHAGPAANLPSGEAVPSSNQVMDSQGTSFEASSTGILLRQRLRSRLLNARSHAGPAAGRCHPKWAGAERSANHTVFKGPSSITQDLPSGEAVPSSNQVMDSQGTSTRGFEAAPFRTPGQLQAAATRSGREQSGLRIAPSSRGAAIFLHARPSIGRGGSLFESGHGFSRGAALVHQNLPSGEAVIPSSNQVIHFQGISSRGSQAAPFRTLVGREALCESPHGSSRELVELSPPHLIAAEQRAFQPFSAVCLLQEEHPVAATEAGPFANQPMHHLLDLVHIQ